MDFWYKKVGNHWCTWLILQVMWSVCFWYMKLQCMNWYTVLHKMKILKILLKIIISLEQQHTENKEDFCFNWSFTSRNIFTIQYEKIKVNIWKIENFSNNNNNNNNNNNEHVSYPTNGLVHLYLHKYNWNIVFIFIVEQFLIKLMITITENYLQ